jgi:hypothetical protein
LPFLEVFYDGEEFLVVNLVVAFSRRVFGEEVGNGLQLDWPDRTVGLGPDRTGLILVRSGPKVKDRTVKQSPFLVQTGLKLL